MKKLFIALIVLTLSLGYSLNAKASKKDELQEYLPNGSGGFDLSIANDEKLIDMLKKSGTIPSNASMEEANEILNQYLKNRASQSSTEKGELFKEERKVANEKESNLYNYSLLEGKGNKKGHKNDLLPNVVEEEWNGSVTTDRILVLLIDFPDYPHNSIKPGETDMYYNDYSLAHYNDMIFGDNGYIGPNGENFISMKQFYEQQSGGSYTIEGQIAGWYTASHNASYYGGNVPDINGNDDKPRNLVYEALMAVANDDSVDLNYFDQEDRYDLDGDGNYREPDGLIDHLMIIHAGVGEEAGGGSLGSDAIWSHRWNLGGVVTLPNTKTKVKYWDRQIGAYDYTIEPEDGAAGVFIHEYGHDLGLPDEYDTIYSGKGEPVSYWSIMSSGSWAGWIGGTEPTGFSPWARLFLQSSLGGNWISGSTVDVNDLDNGNVEVVLDQANSKGTNNDVLMVTLPDKVNIINTPFSGEYEYHSGNGNNVNNYMYTTVDLTNATEAMLTFKAWYQIELDWDYASVFVQDANGNMVTVPGNITTEDNPYNQNPGHGITGHSDGWVDAEFDLSEFVGQVVNVGLNYWTDGYVVEPGLYVDDIKVTVDNNVVLLDDVESDPLFTLLGFVKDQGKTTAKHYYLVEWRNHQGVDSGLGNIRRGNSVMRFEPGMLVWYVDNSFDNNWTGAHPGDGFLGVVDADQHENRWSDGEIGSTRYQVHDAAFGLQTHEKMYLDYKNYYGFFMNDNDTQNNPLFDDYNDYSNKLIPDSGRNVPSYGLKIRVIGESDDRSVGKIILFK